MIALFTVSDITPDRIVRERGKTEFLVTGHKLKSKNAKTTLEMQKDGNLVLYCTGNHEKLWSSGTEGRSINRGLKIQVSQISYHTLVG